MKKSNNKFMQMQKKIEKAVVSGYKMIENSVVSGYKKIENKFVDTFLSEDSSDEQPNTKKSEAE